MLTTTILVEHLSQSRYSRWANNLQRLLKDCNVVAYGAGLAVYSGQHIEGYYTIRPSALFLQDVLNLRAYLKEAKPNRLLTLTAKDTLIAALALQGFDIPLLGSLHGAYSPQHIIHVLKPLAAHLCRSRGDDLPPAILVPVPPTTSETRIAPDKPFFLSSLSDNTIYNQAIVGPYQQQASKLAPLYIVGDSSYKPTLSKQAAAKIHLVGSVGNIQEWYDKALLYLHIGSEVSFTAYEALLSGLPVVSLTPEPDYFLRVEANDLSSVLLELRRYARRRSKIAKEQRQQIGDYFNSNRLQGQVEATLETATTVTQLYDIYEILNQLDRQRSDVLLNHCFAKLLNVSATLRTGSEITAGV